MSSLWVNLRTIMLFLIMKYYVIHKYNQIIEFFANEVISFTNAIDLLNQFQNITDYRLMK